MLVPVAVSNRHIHLSEKDFKQIFGQDVSLSKRNDLSQPGEFAANETVALVGLKGVIQNVRILGPFRNSSQVEISRTDSFTLGIKASVRDSGDLAGSPGIIIAGPKGAVTLGQGLIIARRHVHMTPEDASRFGVRDKQMIKARITGERAMVLGEVLCRVSKNYRLEMHLDLDEANAASINCGALVEILQ
ncbi:MAG: phosphate propanoyltransferase [Candidatus Wallbacteria bacterium]|nr:phosphate propanoyltransferase [Candidatus Wallbacteria bacterium]